MSIKNKVRALRDPEFRSSLNNLVNHPSGMQELEDATLASITGGCAGVPGCTGGGGGLTPTTPLFSCGPNNTLQPCF